MVRREIAQNLFCPETLIPVTAAPADLIARVNQAIAGGSVVNRGGDRLREPLEGGLLRQDGAVLYIIIDGIPQMLAEDGVLLDQPALRGAHG